MHRQTRYLPKNLSRILPNDVAQTYYILPDEEKDMFEDYYKPFITMPDIPPEFPYHVLKAAAIQPISKKYLHDKEVENALSEIEHMKLKKIYLMQQNIRDRFMP